MARALLQRVCEDVKTEGYELIEIYPQDNASFSDLDFNGPMRMYQNTGFEESERHGKTIVMRKTL